MYHSKSSILLALTNGADGLGVMYFSDGPSLLPTIPFSTTSILPLSVTNLPNSGMLPLLFLCLFRFVVVIAQARHWQCSWSVSLCIPWCQTTTISSWR